jgi:glycosyltransferase involved in cell wall biosynthesis
MLVQKIDLDDPILGFTHSWIERLAQRVERLYCIGLMVGRHDLDESGVKVFSLGKERDYRLFPDLQYLFNLYRVLGEIERDGGVDILFSHMAPVFAIAAAPYARWRRVPLVQWYAHPTVNWRLKLAHLFCTRIVTSLPTAYLYKHDKVSVVGQGIGTDFFSPDGGRKEERMPVILCVGRISPAKELETLLHASARLRKRTSKPFCVAIVGGPGVAEDENYLDGLRELCKSLGIDDIVSFEGPVPYGEELVDWYRRCAVHVNLTPAGFGDKVALEAMSCGALCIVANEGYQETLGDAADKLIFRSGDPEELAKKLEWALSLSHERREEVGLYLRERIVRMHGLDRLVERLVGLFGEISTKHSRT